MLFEYYIKETDKNKKMILENDNLSQSVRRNKEQNRQKTFISSKKHRPSPAG